MTRNLVIDPKDPSPIWRQIEEGLRRLVASGAIKPGAPIPSVRELARDLSVNPATVVRAYQRLCETGTLTVRRGEGTFVSESPPFVPASRLESELREGALKYASMALTVGAGRPEAITTLESVFDELEGKEGRRR